MVQSGEKHLWTLGISCSHNGAVALVRDGKVVCAIQAERLTRVKRQGLYLDDDAETLTECVRYCVDAAGIEYGDLSSIAICTPWHLENLSRDALSALIGGAMAPEVPVITVPHHYAHAEYAVHYSKLEPGLVLIVDGSGSYETDRSQMTVRETIHPDARLFISTKGKETISAYLFDGMELQLVYRFGHPASRETAPPAGIMSIRLLQSIGHLWRWASWYCCGGGNDAGKVMGLAAHGKVSVHANLDFARVQPDGSLSIRFDLLNQIFRSPNVAGVEISGNRHFADLAAAIQDRTNRILVDLLTTLKQAFPAERLYYAGGVALNVVANEVIARSGLFATVHMNGSCEDNGTAIGAALAAQVHGGRERVAEAVTDYYGRDYDDAAIVSALESARCPYRRIDDSELAEEAAKLIAKGIANPTDPRAKFVLDLIVKRRERYRPYAPAVLAERSKEFFDIDGMSPVMLREGAVHNPTRLPAIAHVDKSARVQTVNRADNPRYYELIKRFGTMTGVPVVLNTSYNLAGEPIVETPVDAVRSFVKSGLRNLVIGNYIVDRPLTA
jgi:carbamoyltransferase